MNRFQRILPAALLLMGSVAQAQTTIHLKGQVVGNVDSCMVALVDEEIHKIVSDWHLLSLWVRVSPFLLRLARCPVWLAFLSLPGIAMVSGFIVQNSISS